MLDNTLIIFSSDNGGATSALFATGASQGKTTFDPDFDIDDDGLPHEKAVIPGL